MSATTVRLTGPEDLIAVVPHLFGFTPTQSIVAIDLIPGAPPRLGFMERLDLPAEGEAAAAAEALTEPMLRHGSGVVVLIGYETITGEAVPALVMAGDAMRAAGISVFDQMVVTGDRWRSFDCTDPACCPAEGKPVPGAENPAALSLIGTGSAPMKDRQAVEDQLAPTPRASAVLDLIAAERAAGNPTGEAAAEAWGAVLTSTDPLTDQTIATASLALTLGESKQFRDTLLAWMNPGLLPLEMADPTVLALLQKVQGPATTPDAPETSARTITDRLITLCANLPDSEAAPALTVLANYAWCNGNGTIASLALQRALSAQPDYSLALLLHRMVSLGIPLR